MFSGVSIKRNLGCLILLINDKCSKVVEFFNPNTIYFLGDMFHSHINSEWNLFENWTLKSKFEIILINGNHDIISPLKYKTLGIKILDELVEKDFLLTHHPEERKSFFNFCGNIHPAVKIRGSGKQSLRLPCFFKSPNQLILPVFGNSLGHLPLNLKKRTKYLPLPMA